MLRAATSLPVLDGSSLTDFVKVRLMRSGKPALYCRLLLAIQLSKATHSDARFSSHKSTSSSNVTEM